MRVRMSRIGFFPLLHFCRCCCCCCYFKAKVYFRRIKILNDSNELGRGHICWGVENTFLHFRPGVDVHTKG